MSIFSDIAQFHINMLNDKQRTSSYLDCIRDIVHPGDVVLDIGTGTGIYALAAARAGARHVYAVEADLIARAAGRLFAANGVGSRITLIRGFSTNIWLPERADVLISELIGDEPLAEHVIGITQDAVRRLLRPRARLIPERIRMFVLLVSIPVLVANIDLRNRRHAWIGTRRVVTVVAAGELNGLIIYFELAVPSKMFLSTHPALVAESNHWLSPVRILRNPISVTKGNKLILDYYYRPRCGRSEGRIRPTHVSSYESLFS
jgi:predicted RNA methylase